MDKTVCGKESSGRLNRPWPRGLPALQLGGANLIRGTRPAGPAFCDVKSKVMSAQPISIFPLAKIIIITKKKID